jgi:hypothetical protein
MIYQPGEVTVQPLNTLALVLCVVWAFDTALTPASNDDSAAHLGWNRMIRSAASLDTVFNALRSAAAVSKRPGSGRFIGDPCRGRVFLA